MMSISWKQTLSWYLLLLGIVCGQGAVTIHWLGGWQKLDQVWNESPLLSGDHPIHFYHGKLGAASWIHMGSSSCYDPTFQIGYPKTPVYDPGSRMAECFLLVSGTHPMAGYKIGVLSLGLLVPIAFALMSYGLMFRAGACCLSALLASWLWWTPGIHELIEQGATDLIIGAIFAGIHLCWWIRFSEEPWIHSWGVLTLSAIGLWYTQPWLGMTLFPAILCWYLWVAYRHGIAWHLSVWACTAMTLLATWNGITDW